MNPCDYQKNILPMLLNELDPVEAQKLQEHIKSCKACSLELRELTQVDSLLSHYEREPVPQSVYAAYTKALQKRFAEPTWKRATQWLLDRLRPLAVSQQMRFRLARTIAVLLVGVWVGRLFFSPTVVQNPAPVAATLTAEDIQFIADYFVKSELLLLTIVNSSPALTQSDISLDLDMARSLLSKSTTVQRKAVLLQDDTLISFLNRLEVLLLEISNRDNSQIQDAFRELRQQINEAKMVQKSRQLQDQLLTTLSQST